MASSSYTSHIWQYLAVCAVGDAEATAFWEAARDRRAPASRLIGWPPGHLSLALLAKPAAVVVPSGGVGPGCLGLAT